MEHIIDYPTHRLNISQEEHSAFTKVSIFVKGKVYNDMVDAIIGDDTKSLHFVYNERILINGFLVSLVSFHNKKYKDILPRFVCFGGELSYYEFCVENDLVFEEQKWCKTTYIRSGLNDAADYLTNASILLIQTLYPEFIDKSRDILIDLKVPSRQKPAVSRPQPIEIPIAKPSRYKCNPQEYSYFLRDNNIEKLYHFTSTQNCESIRTNGICSIQYLEDNGITVHYASSSESRNIDRRKNKLDYVHLSYERKNPMLFIALKEGRLSDYYIYEISTDVIFLRDTLFTHCNAAKNGAVFSNELSYMMQIPFKEFHNQSYNPNSIYKDYFMAEILVKDRVETSQILNLC